MDFVGLILVLQIVLLSLLNKIVKLITNHLQLVGILSALLFNRGSWHKFSQA
jgi:hypothetical protein